MPSPIDALTSAGFSPDEVSEWQQQRSSVLATAGFKENEIEAYFAGGIAAPNRVPQAMEDRLQAGHEARQREGGLLQTIPQGIEMISTPEGRTRLWEAVKKYPSKFIDDQVNMAKLPGDVAAGKIDLTTEEGMDQAIGLGMLVAGSRLNKLSQTGKTSGMAVALGETVSRIDRGPMGEIVETPIGTMARSEDFVSASQIMAGEEAPMAVQQKMLRAYEEQGIHPAELAHDAQTDPIVAQRLLSSDAADMPPSRPPPRPPEEPPAPPAPPEPPAPHPEGSFEAAQQKILDKISVGESAPKERMTWDKFYTQAVDDLHPLKGVSEDAYTLARLTRGSTGKAEHFLEYGTYDFNTYKTNGKPLAEILKPVAADLEPVRAYLASKRAIEIEGGGKLTEKGLRIDRSADQFGDHFNVVDQAGDKHYTVSVDTKTVPGIAGIDWIENQSRAHSGLGPDIYRQLAAQYAAEGKKLVVGMESSPSAQKVHATLEKDGAVRRVTPESITKDPDVLKHLNEPYSDGRQRTLYEVVPAKEGRKSGMDMDAARKVAAEGDAKYGKIAEEIVGYQNNLLKYMRDSGVLTEESFAAMSEAGKNYIPFYRVFEAGETGAGAGKGFGPGNPLKKLKGSERDIIDPLESIIKNTYAYVAVAERNAVGLKLIDALKADGAEVTVGKARGKDPELAAYLKENGVTNPEAITDFIKTAAQQDGETIGAFRNGVKETVKVNDPDLVTAFRGLDQGSAGMLAKVLAVPASALRAGAVLSPDFIVRNVVRDFMTAFVNSKGVFSPIDTFKGLKSAIAKDADFQDWLKGGGSNSALVGLDRRYLQESLQKLNTDTGLMERSWNVIKHPIESTLAPLRLMSELAENATRLGEFKKLVGEGGKDAIQSAAFASREVTLDFARIGASMRAYNMITAFGNAQMQGLDRVGRAFIDRPGNTMLKVAGGITLPSVLLWFANKDDERVKDLPAWQKDMFWIVATKDHLYRIPKPFELGVVFGSGVERVLDATLGNNPDAFKKFSKSIVDIVMPSMTPTVAQPLLEQFANRSTMSDRTLIPADMEKHLPEYQYTPYTTELTKALGKIVSAFPGMRSESMGPGAPFGPIARAVTSPILMENYIRSWTGGLGNYALQIADAILRKTGVLPDPIMPAATLADIPVVKAFVVRYPSASSQSIQDFYDQHEVGKKFFDTWMAKAKEGDADAMARIQAAGGPMMFLRLDAIKETLTEHSKLIRDITKNPSVDAKEKRQLIDSLYFNMIEIGKGGKQMMRDSKAALEPAAP